MRNRIEIAVTPPGGEPQRRAGDTLTILRKEADGRWRLARDANLRDGGGDSDGGVAPLARPPTCVMLRSRPRGGRRLEARTRMPSWATVLCADGSFYTGCTSDLDIRFGAASGRHARRLHRDAAAGRAGPAEEFQHIDEVIAAEWRIKWPVARQEEGADRG